MTEVVARLRGIIADLQSEVEKEIGERRDLFRYRLDQRKVIFEQEVVAQHRQMRMKLGRFMRESALGAVLTAPILYIQIIPVSLMDIFATFYQQTCFRVYGIPLVKRGEHVIMDRKYLAYLNWIEKLNCIYCEYANGVVSYVREIASRTEQYWCPIKHASKLKDPLGRYYDFLEYGDAEGFQEKLAGQRNRCRACEASGSCGRKAGQ